MNNNNKNVWKANLWRKKKYFVENEEKYMGIHFVEKYDDDISQEGLNKV